MITEPAMQYYFISVFGRLIMKFSTNNFKSEHGSDVVVTEVNHATYEMYDIGHYLPDNGETYD